MSTMKAAVAEEFGHNLNVSDSIPICQNPVSTRRW